MCVPIPTDKPLTHVVRIGSLKQKLEYEGLNLICFNCGKISHKKEHFSDLIPVNPVNANVNVSDATVNVNLSVDNSQNSSGKDMDGFGEWMLVSRRKHKSPASKHSIDNSNKARLTNQRGESRARSQMPPMMVLSSNSKGYSQVHNKRSTIQEDTNKGGNDRNGSYKILKNHCIYDGNNGNEDAMEADISAEDDQLLVTTEKVKAKKVEPSKGLNVNNSSPTIKGKETQKGITQFHAE